MPITSDLWRSFKDGPDGAGFEKLYSASKAYVYTICYRVLQDEEGAEEALQDVYTRIYVDARKGALQGEDNPERFLGRLAHNEATKLRRREGRRSRRETPMEDVPDEATSEPDGREAAAEKELRATLHDMAQELPEKLRVPLMLHYFHGMSHRQIADILNLPNQTVTSRIKAALARLEPTARQAGLKDLAGAFMAIMAGASLLDPPRATAATVYAHIQAAAPALIAGGKASTVLVLTKAKVLVMTAAAAVVLAMLLTVIQPDQSASSPAPSSSSLNQAQASPGKEAQPMPPEAGTATPLPIEGSSRTGNGSANGSIPSGLSAIPAAASQTVLYGFVMDADTSMPLAGARINGMTDRGLPVPEARAGAAGEFRIVLPEGDVSAVRLIARLGSRASHRRPEDAAPSTIRTGQTNGPFYLRLPSTAMLTVLALDAETQEPVANAEVQIEGSSTSGRTHEDGSAHFIELEPTGVEVHVLAPGYAATQAVIDLSLSDGLLEVQLPREGWLKGRVEDASGAPIEGVAISASVPGYMYRPLRAVTDQDGNFKIGNMPVELGTIDLQLSKEGFAQFRRQLLPIPSSTREKEIVVEMSRGITIRGKVTQEGGEAVPYASVSAQFTHESTGVEARADERGIFEVNHLAEGAGDIRITASAPGFAPTITLVPFKGESLIEDVSAIVEKGRVVTGRVLSHEGTPLAGVRVLPSIVGVVITAASAVHTDAAGRFEIPGMPAEAHLDFRLDGYERKRFVPAIGSPEAPMDVVLMPTARVRARVVDAETGEPIRTFRVYAHEMALDHGLGWAEGVVFDTEDGVFELKGNVEEAAAVSISAQGYSTQMFSLSTDRPEGEEFQVLTMNKNRTTVKVQVVDGNGKPIPGADVFLAVLPPRHPPLVVYWSNLSLTYGASERLEKRTSDRNGRAMFSDVHTSSVVDLAVRCNGMANQRITLPRQLSSDEHEVVVVMMPAAALTASARRSDFPNAQILSLRKGDEVFATLGSSGDPTIFRMNSLPPGTYEVFVRNLLLSSAPGEEAALTRVTLSLGEERAMELEPSPQRKE